MRKKNEIREIVTRRRQCRKADRNSVDYPETTRATHSGQHAERRDCPGPCVRVPNRLSCRATLYSCLRHLAGIFSGRNTSPPPLRGTKFFLFAFFLSSCLFCLCARALLWFVPVWWRRRTRIRFGTDLTLPSATAFSSFSQSTQVFMCNIAFKKKKKP